MQNSWKGKFAITMVLALGAFVYAQAKDKSSDSSASELQRATATVENITSAAPAKSVPTEVLKGAKSVAVIPKLV